LLIFLFQAEDGIRVFHVTGVQTCAPPISARAADLRQRFGAADQEAGNEAGDHDPGRGPALAPQLAQAGAAAFGMVHGALHAYLGALHPLAQMFEPHCGASGGAGARAGAGEGGTSSSSASSWNSPIRVGWGGVACRPM